MRRERRVAWARAMPALLLAGCSVAPYQPARLRIPGGFPADAYARALAVLQQGWQPLAETDSEGFRLQSGWLPHEQDGAPGQKRATVFLDDPVTLAVLVEVRFLRLPSFGAPRWTTARGDPALERRLVESLRRAMLGG